MTTLTTEARDHRASPTVLAGVLAAGGVLYATSHALNLLGSSGDVSLPHEIASKYLFGVGALLILVGLAAVAERLRFSRLALVGLALTAIGMLVIALSAYSTLYILPLYGWEGLAAIDQRAWPIGVIALPSVVAGPVLVAAAGLRHRALPIVPAVLLIVSSVAFLIMIPLPALEAPLAIGTTILTGACWTWIGVDCAAVARRSRAA